MEKYILTEDFKMKFAGGYRECPEVLTIYGYEASLPIADIFDNQYHVKERPEWILLPIGTVIKILSIDIRERKRRGLWSKVVISLPTKDNVLLSKKIDVFKELANHIPGLTVSLYTWSRKPLVARTFKFSVDTNALNGMEVELYDTQGK